MSYCFECLLEVNEVVVKVALVLYVFCNYDTAVEYVQLYSILLRSLQHHAWVPGQAYCPAVPALSEAYFLW